VKMKLMLLTLLAGACICSAAEKPTIYNCVNNESSAIDPLVNAALAPKFTIVDIRDSADYVQPKPTAARLPRIARTPTGEPLGGYVLVAYVITTEGRVTDAVVLKSADERLNGIAMKAIEGWRFAPATLKGVAIPTTAAQEFTFETTPTEFVQQVLEPTGGKIQRPKDWFYAEGHRGPVYMWTLSREDTTGHKPYTTGVRIQTFTGVKDGTGKTARQFVLDFVAAKKKEATKVIKTCDENDQGLFTRICLETEEGNDHILYSLFWGTNDLDIAVISIAGTTKELWETYSPAFDKMSAFELIDMKRFEKK
jgi:TonB family protein